ncbi:UNVERIFIED_CONTAM: hypothetical protein HDU68_010489, partial [Siphonaria sp. JEL0065]
MTSKPNESNPPTPTRHEPYKYMDCEWSMRTMDALFNASFVEFIKNEKNCDFNGRHVAHLFKNSSVPTRIFGGIEATNETDFMIPGSTKDFLYNFDDQDDGNYTNGDDEDETDSILNNPVLATRTNSILSMNGMQMVNRGGAGSEFSRGPSEASFLGVGLVSDSTGIVIPNAVFETHHQSINDFRSASSMMSLALSSLDLIGVTGPLKGGGSGGR